MSSFPRRAWEPEVHLTTMFLPRRNPTSIADRGPLRVMFVITSMPVGGAETLLTELIRRMDRRRFSPELCCLKNFDRLGETLSHEVPAFTGLLSQKYDFAVLWRLTRLMRRRQIDAVVTVGTGGDKMFWGRLAGRLAGVPVICSALHSTGLPDRVELPNRLLAPLTDAFIAVAEPHGRYLAEHEGCPARKVVVIPNGVDVERFHPRPPNHRLQKRLNLDPGAPVAGIVAALRPEKNHEMFLRVAALVHEKLPAAHFLIVGDGPERAKLESLARELGIADAVRFLGTRSDVDEILPLLDVLLLTSHMEANPICLLEAMACEKPVVATRVGSVTETVLPGVNGYLVAPDDSQDMAARVLELFADRHRAAELGRAAREQVVTRWSVAGTVRGYEGLISRLYTAKAGFKTPILS
jgi:glycosyltransferase involved in cell wall biosynthesis